MTELYQKIGEILKFLAESTIKHRIVLKSQNTMVSDVAPSEDIWTNSASMLFQKFENVEHCVPQGCVLRPRLFSLYCIAKPFTEDMTINREMI